MKEYKRYLKDMGNDFIWGTGVFLRYLITPMALFPLGFALLCHLYLFDIMAYFNI